MYTYIYMIYLDPPSIYNKQKPANHFSSVPAREWEKIYSVILQGIIFGVDPGRLTRSGSQFWTVFMDRGQYWDRREESDYALSGKRPGPAGSRLPRCNEKL